MWRHFRIAVVFSLVTVIPVSATLIIFAEPIITLAFGYEYAPSANTLTLLAISQAFAALTIPCAGLLVATGRGSTFGLINFVAVLVNMSLNLVLIPWYGALGAALASLVSVFLMFSWQAGTIWRHRRTITATARYRLQEDAEATARDSES